MLPLLAVWIACGENGVDPQSKAGLPAPPPPLPADGPLAPAAPALGAAGSAPAAPPAQNPSMTVVADPTSPAANSSSPAARPPAAPAGPPGISIDEATGELVFRTEPISLGSGEEAYKCYGATLEEDVVVDGFSQGAQKFVHHAQFFEALWPEPEGTSVCNEQFKLTWLPIFLAGSGASEMRFDEGIGHVIPAGTQLVLQMHLFNATEKNEMPAAEIRMHRSSSKNPTPVGPWAIGSSQINLAPRQPGVAQNVCTMSGPATLVAVFPHMHMLGKQFRVEVGKTMDAMKPLYTRAPYNFDDQRMEKVNIALEAGDILRVTCDYMNTTDDVVTFGESSNDEMCFFVGFAVGDSMAADCPNLWEALFTL
jgi:hypothetical protein